MDIALSGFIPPSFTGAERGQSLRGNGSDRQAISSDARQGGNNTDNARVVRGEIIAARLNPNREVNTTQQSILERDATFSQSDTRRFSLRDAISTFERNEALIADPEKPRQISGIIDEYV